MEQKVILFQGDSITDADRNRTNDLSMGCGYPTLVTGHLGAAFPYQYKFYNRGIGGHRVVAYMLALKRI